MRAQLAVSSLIVFGIILIGLGFTGLPYVLSYDETVVVQTSRFRTVEQQEVFAETTTLQSIIALETTVTSTVPVVETVTTTTTVSRIVGQIVNETIQQAALVTGPFYFWASSILEVNWRSNSTVDVFLVYDDYQNASTWMLLGRGYVGSTAMRIDSNSSLYIIVRAANSAATFNLVISETSAEAATVTKTAFVTTYRAATYTTTAYTTSERTFTTTLVTTRPEFYVTTIVTAVTETRYPDLSFMSFMGSFLVFVGILFMVLLLKTMARPVD